MLHQIFKKKIRKISQTSTNRIGIWIVAGVLCVDPLEDLERLLGLAALEQELGALREGKEPEPENERRQGAECHEQVPRLEVEVVRLVREVQRHDQPGYYCDWRNKDCLITTIRCSFSSLSSYL